MGDELGYHELLMGCGRRPYKKAVFVSGQGPEFVDVIGLDYNPDHEPDIVWDLRHHPLPFDDNYFDEIHAYDVLEHLAYQGDEEFFFAEFSEYWRILRPHGVFCATVPWWESKWAWGDPSHKRVITPQTLGFLVQANYTNGVGVSKMSDYRRIYKADFNIIYAKQHDDGFFVFALEALKERG